MTDSELTRLAFKAAFNGADINHDQDMLKRWSPLTDDGDALRLAVKLDIHVLRFENMTTAQPLSADWGCDERDDGDSCAATRRAIVRAAAEIGKTMP